jgi:hypothetical protein
MDLAVDCECRAVDGLLGTTGLHFAVFVDENEVRDTDL